MLILFRDLRSLRRPRSTGTLDSSASEVHALLDRLRSRRHHAGYATGLSTASRGSAARAPRGFRMFHSSTRPHSSATEPRRGLFTALAHLPNSELRPPIRSTRALRVSDSVGQSLLTDNTSRITDPGIHESLNPSIASREPRTASRELPTHYKQHGTDDDDDDGEPNRFE